MKNENVGCLSLNVVRLEGIGREVLDVLGHDYAGARADSRGEDVAVIGVGKLEAWY